MNMQQIMNMLTRMIMRRGLNWGINEATRQMSKPGTRHPGGKATPAAQQQGRGAREAAKRARQAAQITRRLGR